MFGVKWRAEHPSVAGAESQLQNLLPKAQATRVSTAPRRVNGKLDFSPFVLSKAEFKPFIDSLKLSPEAVTPVHAVTDLRGVIFVSSWVNESLLNNTKLVEFVFNIHTDNAKVVVRRGKRETEYKLAPAAAKRWVELLLANPRIGPELRARMK